MKTVLVASFVVMVISIIIRVLADRYDDLPHFVWNRVGKNFAVAGIADYLKKERSVIAQRGDLRIVPETFVVAGSGDARDAVQVVYGFPNEEKKDLFVPGASERYLSFEEQEEIFIPIADGREFFERKQRENRAADFRLRFSYFFNGDRVKIILATITFFAAFVCATSLLVVLERWEKRAGELVVLYTTAPGHAVTETRLTRKAQIGSSVSNDLYHVVYLGKVVGVTELGGGIYRVCVSQIGGGYACGSSSPFKIGDTAAVREITVASWKSAFGGGYYNYRQENIVITEEEARQLQATGKFTIQK